MGGSAMTHCSDQHRRATPEAGHFATASAAMAFDWPDNLLVIKKQPSTPGKKTTGNLGSLASLTSGLKLLTPTPASCARIIPSSCPHQKVLGVGLRD